MLPADSRITLLSVILIIYLEAIRHQLVSPAITILLAHYRHVLFRSQYEIHMADSIHECKRPGCHENNYRIVQVQGKQGNQRNVGRWHLRCAHCDKFKSWQDMQGVSPDNPDCICNEPSRLTHKNNGDIFYDCALKNCDYSSKYVRRFTPPVNTSC